MGSASCVKRLQGSATSGDKRAAQVKAHSGQRSEPSLLGLVHSYMMKSSGADTDETMRHVLWISLHGFVGLPRANGASNGATKGDGEVLVLEKVAQALHGCQGVADSNITRGVIDELA